MAAESPLSWNELKEEEEAFKARTCILKTGPLAGASKIEKVSRLLHLLMEDSDNGLLFGWKG